MTDPFTDPESRWLQTFSGRQYFPLAPRPEDVDIVDIAHHLSMQCRFSGATRFHYSVAQHSILVSYECDTPDALRGLLHDASEAFLVDVPAPIKGDLGRYKEIEALNQTAILTALLGTEEAARPQPASVTHADLVLLATEKRNLMAPEPAPWIALPPPMDARIEMITPWQAEWRFLYRYHRLRGTFFPYFQEWFDTSYPDFPRETIGDRP